MNAAFQTSVVSPPLVAAQPDDSGGATPNPLFHAGKWLLADLISTLVFSGLFALTHNIALATGLGIAVGVAQIVREKILRRSVDAMQWMSLALVIFFGAASFFTDDPRFVMVKPTLIYALVGVTMLNRGWMTRYMTPVVLRWSADVTTVFGYVWAALMFASGALNLLLAMSGDVRSWTWFVAVFPLASKLGLFTVQYVTTRAVTVRRMRAAARDA